MKMTKTLTALIAGAGLGLSGHAFAAGTDANTDITNTVTLDYAVSGVDQNDVTSAATFKVDQKVDMTLVSNTASAATAPGETVALQYTLTNTGNKAQAFVLSVTNNGNADHTPISYAFYTDSGLTPANRIANNKVTLTEDEILVVYAGVEITKNANVKNGTTVEMMVSAAALDPSDTNGTVLLTQDLAADKNTNLTTEYVVFAEGATINSDKQNGTITVQTNRSIVTANFTDPTDSNATPKLAVKIINDAICDSDFTTANTEDYSQGGANVGTCPDVLADNKANYRPKAIPTSLAKFTYQAKNSGAVAANDVTFTETLPAGYQASSMSNPTLKTGATGSLATQVLTQVFDAPDAANEYNITSNTLTIFVGDVPANNEVEVTYTGIVE